MLQWIGIDHVPKVWKDAIRWVLQVCKGKSTTAELHKQAIAEAVYGIWNYRNCITFRKIVDRTKIGEKIIDNIVYRG